MAASPCLSRSGYPTVGKRGGEFAGLDGALELVQVAEEGGQRVPDLAAGRIVLKLDAHPRGVGLPTLVACFVPIVSSPGLCRVENAAPVRPWTVSEGCRGSR